MSTISRLIIAATIVLLPLVTTSGGIDNFREPKDSLLIAAAAAMLVLGALAFCFRPFTFRVTAEGRRAVILIAAALAWTFACALMATSRTLSLMSLVWMLALIVFGLATAILAPGESLSGALWPLVAPSINAAIYLLQRFRIWSPIRFTDDVPEHFRHTALIGNPDDAASFFVAPAVAALALVMVTRGWRRVLAGSALAVLTAALVTGRITGILAAGAGAAALFILQRGKRGLIGVAGVAVLLIAAGLAFAPLRTRALTILSNVRAGDLAEATSGRITPFLAAASMAIDHPVMGVGPRCFAFEYFPYKLRVEKRRPKLARAFAHTFNFGEVHNDHLQTLAECGVIGYALLVLAILALIRAARRAAGDDERAEFARHAVIPLAVALAVLSLAHFPLHLTAPAIMFVYFGALMWGWSGHAPVMEPHRAPITLRLAIPVVILGLSAITIYRFSYLPWVCQNMAVEIQRRTEAASRATDYDAAPMARLNLEKLAPCINGAQSDIGMYMLAASNYRLLSRLDDARATYEAALRYDRRPEIYYELGSVELEMGQRAAALQTLYPAIQFSRSYLDGLPADVVEELKARLRREDPHLLDR